MGTAGVRQQPERAAEWPYRATIRATFGTSLTRAEEVAEVVRDALVEAFGTANGYEVAVEVSEGGYRR